MEMNDEANQMKKFVGLLTILVNGKTNTARKRRGEAKTQRQPEGDSNARVLLPDDKLPASTSKEVGPEHLTPINDEDFSDF